MTEKTIARKRAKFLAALATTCNVIDSCQLAGLKRSTAYEWRDADPEFARAWAIAKDMGAEALEDAGVKRAVDGVAKPIYQQGRKVGEVTEYSDQLLMFLLKGPKPEKYKDRVVDPLLGVTYGELVKAAIERGNASRALTVVPGGRPAAPPLLLELKKKA